MPRARSARTRSHLGSRAKVVPGEEDVERLVCRSLVLDGTWQVVLTSSPLGHSFGSRGSASEGRGVMGKDPGEGRVWEGSGCGSPEGSLMKKQERGRRRLWVPANFRKAIKKPILLEFPPLSKRTSQIIIKIGIV